MADSIPQGGKLKITLPGEVSASCSAAGLQNINPDLQCVASSDKELVIANGFPL
ncbi:MAG: hypothetical protein ACK56I_04005 [bacterium]